jgi:hypothetical protein
MASILRNNEPNHGDFVGLHSAFNPLELTLGWVSGMNFLLDSGQVPFSALHLAIETRDIPSFKLLIAHNSPLFVDEKDAFECGTAGRNNSLALIRSSDCAELVSL